MSEDTGPAGSTDRTRNDVARGTGGKIGGRGSRVTAIAAVLVVLGIGAGAFLIGHSEAPDATEAGAVRSQAVAEAFEKSLAAARIKGLDLGRARGGVEGRRAGRKAGHRRGTTDGGAAAQAQIAEAAAAAAAAEAAAEAAAAEAASVNLPPGYVPYPSTSPAPSGRPGIDPGCYPVDGIPCD